MRGCVSLFVLALMSCNAKGPPPAPTAEVGVFFGGQVQRLSRVEVSTVRPPNMGFRVDFLAGASGEPLRHEITYELTRPGPSGRRVTQKGKLRLPEGQTRLDHVFPFEASYKLGVWNVRVVQGDHLLADRALYLVPPGSSSP